MHITLSRKKFHAMSRKRISKLLKRGFTLQVTR